MTRILARSSSAFPHTTCTTLFALSAAVRSHGTAPAQVGRTQGGGLLSAVMTCILARGSSPSPHITCPTLSASSAPRSMLTWYGTCFSEHIPSRGLCTLCITSVPAAYILQSCVRHFLSHNQCHAQILLRAVYVTLIPLQQELLPCPYVECKAEKKITCKTISD